MAADVARKPTSAPALPHVYNWSGLYVGAHVGFGQGRTTVSDPTGPVRVNVNTKGFLGGGQLGYNHQIGAWVFGVEADFSGSDIDGDTTLVDSAGDIMNHQSNIRWTSLATGRVGYTFGPWLAYIKGGAAFAKTRYSGYDFTNAVGASGSFTRTGWTGGAGLEYALGQRWSARAQYDYLDFGGKTESVVDSTGAAGMIRFEHNVHQVKFGVNYRLTR